MDKLDQAIKDIEKRLINKYAVGMELKKLSREDAELNKIVEIINIMEERPKTILTRICLNGDSPQAVGKDLGLKPRQIYYSKKDALKMLIAKLN